MGSRFWTSSAYVNHSTTGRGFTSLDAFNAASAQELYRSHHLDPALDPRGVVRECANSDEHPNTKPVILGLDVTGSMGSAAEAVAKQLNDIMSEAYDRVKDIEFMTAAIGDLSYDDVPLQVSQFESDIRVAEQLEKVWFEGGGGGNSWESYTTAWYFGLHQTKLDCYDKQGRKGLIITIGDEPLNPYLPAGPLSKILGRSVQADVDTADLYKEVTEKFNIWHIAYDDARTSYKYYSNRIADTWGKLLSDHFVVANEQSLAKVIGEIIEKSFDNDATFAATQVNENGEISW